MSNKLPSIKPKKIVKLLNTLGFIERRQTGSHLILRHIKNHKIIPVPIHVGEIKKGALISILKQAELSREKFLKLVKEK